MQAIENPDSLSMKVVYEQAALAEDQKKEMLDCQTCTKLYQDSKP